MFKGDKEQTLINVMIYTCKEFEEAEIWALNRLEIDEIVPS